MVYWLVGGGVKTCHSGEVMVSFFVRNFGKMEDGATFRTSKNNVESFLTV